MILYTNKLYQNYNYYFHLIIYYLLNGFPSCQRHKDNP